MGLVWECPEGSPSRNFQVREGFPEKVTLKLGPGGKVDVVNGRRDCGGWEGENNIPCRRSTKHRGLEARKEEGASPGQGLKEVPYSWGKSQVGGEGLWVQQSNEGQIREQCVYLAKWEVGSGPALPLAGFNQTQVGIGLACEKNHSGSWVEDQLEGGQVEHLISVLNG